MIRELNLTHRKTLLNCYDAWLTMTRDGDSDRMFWTVRVALREEAIEELKLDEEFECWVEVYKGSRVERFRLGDGQKMNLMDDSFPTSFDTEIYPLLRIKLVAKNDPLHRILASKDRINPETIDSKGKKEHLLPLRFKDIGIPWMVSDPADSRPWLIIDSNFHREGGTAEDIKGDPLFQALVLPEAYRQILTARLKEENIDKDDIWMRVTAALVNIDALDDETSSADRQKYIELAVQKFCELKNFLTIPSKETSI